ncbi:unnamed protein product (macronuclear) [Paramecium tetraurelia]|uniref:Uncharacterized protein n=1 Tax=Paramecium tetraurelia TaxID=5888 RepID=A0DUE2_PARTE|nr:uncharacterized protein GSPATT00020331001 [Paramecium tetraurelia]CAK86659.1 unnamed protein product [Paramecium tetraurelia]|eukprot:XP_001454056.1 hypothetical protein (macronuclear) [Paramecium tetraurelia strain d4-2]
MSYYRNRQDLFREDSFCIDEDFEFNPDNSPLLFVGKENIFDQYEDDGLDTEKITNTPDCDKKQLMTTSKKIGKVHQIKKTKEQPSRSQSERKKVVYMLPGESKNIPKNFTRALKHFILTHFDSSVQQNPEIKKFLNTKPEKACKQTLENSLKNCQQLKQISKMFFGNIQWGNIFLDENKVELEPYFRFNQIWFGTRN